MMTQVSQKFAFKYFNLTRFFAGFPEAAPAYKRKDLQIENPMMMAKSLPMNVPMPRMMLGRSPPDLDEDTSDIPKKIAELAKSLHVDSIGELPSPRLIE